MEIMARNTPSFSSVVRLAASPNTAASRCRTFARPTPAPTEICPSTCGLPFSTTMLNLSSWRSARIPMVKQEMRIELVAQRLELGLLGCCARVGQLTFTALGAPPRSRDLKERDIHSEYKKIAKDLLVRCSELYALP